jgi:hypothetical protein
VASGNALLDEALKQLRVFADFLEAGELSY